MPRGRFDRQREHDGFHQRLLVLGVPLYCKAGLPGGGSVIVYTYNCWCWGLFSCRGAGLTDSGNIKVYTNDCW